MRDCCEEKAAELAGVRASKGKILRIVLAINAVMFFVEFGAGVAARSSALMADSLDMLGDAVVYAVTLYVLDRGPRWKAAAALFKGLVIGTFGLGVLAEAAHKLVRDVVPDAAVMGPIAALAFAANLACMFLLLRRRGDDINMRSTWLCSVDDVAANAGVLVAAAAVAYTGAKWPDILAGALIALIFLGLSYSVIRHSAKELAVAR